MFEIYKKGQGTIARWIAFLGLSGLAGFGTYELYDALSGTTGNLSLAGASVPWSVLISGLVFVAAEILTAWLINLPKFVDYLIMSEIELRKVSWPTREELKRQTAVVIIALIVFSFVLWLADMVFTAGTVNLYKTK